MDNSRPVLWDRTSDNVQSTLRQPKGLSNVILNSSSSSSTPHSDINTRIEISHSTIQKSSDSTVKSNTNLEELVKNSTLKADAAEWYPSGYYSNYATNNCVEGLTSSVQNRLKLNTKHNDEFNDLEQSVLLNCYNEIENSPDFKRLRQIITTLTKDPGQFDDLLELFMETLAPYYENIIPISVVVKILLEQAINNANFRYTGARLCWFTEQNCPIFRAELHSECTKQIKVNDNTQNVLLFIAELYTQLPHLSVYGALLIDAFKCLFAKGGDENIKCICQALKLTGYTLEHSNKNDLDAVFNQLWSIKDTVRGSALMLLQTVCNLRSCNWGHSNEGSDSDQESDSFLYERQQPTVFVNTEGERLTNEESEFIAAHLKSNDDVLSDTSDPDELCNPEDEMDEEIQEAFREFVKYSSSKQ